MVIATGPSPHWCRRRRLVPTLLTTIPFLRTIADNEREGKEIPEGAFFLAFTNSNPNPNPEPQNHDQALGWFNCQY